MTPLDHRENQFIPVAVAFLTADLLFQSRATSIALSGNVRLIAERSTERLIAKLEDGDAVRLVIVDLTLGLSDLETAINLLKAHCSNARTIAYGPHVHEAKLKRAAEAGFDQVMTRGQFDRQMQSLIYGEASIE